MCRQQDADGLQKMSCKQISSASSIYIPYIANGRLAFI